MNAHSRSGATARGICISWRAGLPDGLRIRGTPQFAGGVIDSQGDHRIAMAFAIAALRASSPIEIRDVANVATSFPGFEERARQAGLGLTTL